MKIEKQFKEYIQNHWDETKQSALTITNVIQNSELNAGGNNYTRTLQIPKFFSKEDQMIFKGIVNQTYKIFEKVIQAYRNDEKIRSLFPFSKELEQLILLEPDYSCVIPICRIDIFYNEQTKDFHFCEFNTDGTSAMNENRRLNEFLIYNNVFQALKPDIEIMELMQTWIHSFLDICQQAHLKKDMHIGIVDFLDKAYLKELYAFEQLFQNQLFSCEVVDIRDLYFDGNHLISKKTNKIIDVIYRRVVTKDVMDNLDLIPDFYQAVQHKKVELIGAFQTQIVHHKCINQVLVHPLMQAYFTKEEQDFIQSHLPATYDLTQDRMQEVLSNKNQWIIKPKDSYASKGVFTGIDSTDEQWKECVKKHVNHDYIVQEYIMPYKSENIDPVNENEFKLYSNLTGLYVYNGQFAGVYSRLSDSGIISSQYNEKTIPTLFLKEK
ncbi:circularly permuted type 2 ATP-grasp protein [Floccifex sp.]|uniref:circularly permuted type 2 ATP-grasp protein n=1 Tax=Floccifex sp. TaxID=2815810 RepID=UPI003F0864C2